MASLSNPGIGGKEFASRMQSDPAFRNFIDEQQDLVDDLLSCCIAVIQSLREVNDPLKSKCARQLLNGPVNVEWIRPKETYGVWFDQVPPETAPLKDEDYTRALRDLTLRTSETFYLFMARTPAYAIDEFLSHEEGMDLVISRATGPHSTIAFVLEPATPTKDV